ncbi:hypothetical protein TIFTF001_056133 [Ficus carica]|uniref:Uncharacterized protein n=1 Tax=Ficus carica TaxID=3494 RepID=A0AA88EGL2_FICCA|nr:hypothetical protein TIFTF001_056130 [Ficus carica]GMN73738.1 hypothetical protein TIFTF001_056131 [Ficus carica]GMN73742.1 hypothetical protein TIFTF001_056132 [Ficus carica]GMN73746.1 hypothetical protein TIFTF001_056133 [Ficus carica]
MINRRPSNEISLPQMYDSGGGGFSVQIGGERSLLAAGRWKLAAIGNAMVSRRGRGKRETMMAGEGGERRKKRSEK